MRKVLNKDELKTSGFVKFLYNNFLGNILLYILTRRFLSNLVGWFLDTKLSCFLIKKYVKKNKIDLNLFLDVKYKSFNDFFTRRIKPENRPFSLQSDHFISPCDGKLSLYEIKDNAKFTIKGYDYTIHELLKNDDLANKYKDGYCVVLRLSVEDYHRYFYVDDCYKENNIFIKGKLHTVQPYALTKRKVFSENCREYTVMHTNNFGIITQIEIGAMMVGRISNNHQSGNYKKGEEKGKFEFGGSTIVLLIEKDKVKFDDEFLYNTKIDSETYVLCGECIGKQKEKQN